MERRVLVADRTRGCVRGDSNGKIYLMGGYNTASPAGIASVDVYDPTTNMWSSVSPMLTARYFAAATAVGDEVYVIGGTQNDGISSPLAVVESYNTTANLWTQRAALPEGRSSLAAVSANGGIYVSGGHTSPSATAIDAAVLAFDPATNTWNAFNGFNRTIFTRADHALLSVPGGLLALGGNSTSVFPNGPTAAVESTLLPTLASPTNWKLKAPMPEPSAGLAAALTGGKVYVVTPTRVLSYSLLLDPL